MWREWGRSFDLKDSTPRHRRWFDVALVWSVQALPIPLLLAIALLALRDAGPAMTGFPIVSSSLQLLEALAIVNGIALAVRLMMLVALRGSYAVRGLSFWLSPLADVPAALRLTLSMLRVPRRWRGRDYAGLGRRTLRDRVGPVVHRCMSPLLHHREQLVGGCGAAIAGIPGAHTFVSKRLVHREPVTQHPFLQR